MELSHSSLVWEEEEEEEEERKCAKLMAIEKEETGDGQVVVGAYFPPIGSHLFNFFLLNEKGAERMNLSFGLVWQGKARQGKAS